MRAPAIIARIAASLLGGYVLVWGASSLGIVALVAAGVDYDEARAACMLLAFVLYLVVFLWAWSARSLWQVWLLLVGGGATMTVLAMLLQHHLAGG
ncbi:MAG: iron uptake protein [Parahaliea sp.]